MRYIIISRKKLYLFVILLFLCAVVSVLYLINNQSKDTAMFVMGAVLHSQTHQEAKNQQRAAASDVAKYFRPSKLPILNKKQWQSDFWFQYENKTPDEIKIPAALLNSPEDTILNYFSIIREGANLTPDKTGGCGTVGNAKLPFPLAYNFFTPDYQKKVDYTQYLKSFEGIGHTNLIKLKELPPVRDFPNLLRYFVELETIEGSDKGVTYFAYYFGYVFIEKQADLFLISDIQLFGEDFLCAPYHGWYHDAESNVSIRYGDWCKMIEKQYPTKLSGYTKKIYFQGTDGGNYIIVFMNLTNGTDIEVAQYKQSIEGQWKVIYLNPEKCVEDKQ